MAAKRIQFPWRGNGSTISTNLDGMWGMSDVSQTVKTGSGFQLRADTVESSVRGMWRNSLDLIQLARKRVEIGPEHIGRIRLEIAWNACILTNMYINK